MSEKKQKKPKAYNVIYDISQGIIPTRCRGGESETSDYDFIINLVLSLL